MKDKIINGFLIFILGVFISVITTINLISSNINVGLILYLLILLLSNVISFCIVHFLSNKITSINLNNREITESNIKVFIIFFLMIFIPIFLYFLGWYPGGMSYDSYSEFIVGLGLDHYAEWQPFMDVFLFYRVPLFVIGKLSFINFYNVLLFSLSYAYLLTKMYKYGCNKIFLTITYLYMITNIFLINMVLMTLKDIHFAMISFMLIAYVIEIYNTDGKWLDKKRNMAMFIIMLLLGQFIKRNGLLFTIPILIYGMMKTDLIRKIIMPASIVVISILYSHMLSIILIDYHDGYFRVVESSGYAYNIWGNVIKENIDAVPEKTLNEINKAVSIDEIKDYYTLGGGNAVKNVPSFNIKVIENMGAGKMFKLTLDCIIHAPKESLYGLLYLYKTPFGYDFWGDMNVYFADDLRTLNEENNVTIDYDKLIEIKPINKNIKAYLKEKDEKIRFNKLYRFIYGEYGMKILIICTLFIIFTCKRNVKSILTLPVIFNHFGSALLLTDTIDYRYFICLIPLFLPAVYLVLSKPKINNNEK